MINTQDDSRLIAAFQRDPSAFQHIYRRYFNPVYRYHYARTNDAHAAEDLTSQTFLSALEALPRYRDNGRFAAWLFTIARHKLIGHYRQRVSLELQETIPSPAPDLLYEIEEQELRQRLSQQLARLRDDERELLSLRFAAGLPFEQIGVMLERSTEAVKKATYRLVERLEREMEAEHA